MVIPRPTPVSSTLHNAPGVRQLNVHDPVPVKPPDQPPSTQASLHNISEQPIVTPASLHQVSAQQPVTQISPSKLSVVIPRTLTAAERAEYEASTIHVGGAKLVQSDRTTYSSTAPVAPKDQRQKAEAVLARLQTLLNEVFEAEIDSGNEPHAERHNIFTTVETTNGNVSVMSPDVLIQLDRTFAKAVRLNCISELPADDVGRIQKLCENIINAVNDLRLAIGDGWDERDVHEWSARIALAEQGLGAGRIILRIMTAGLENKQLFSEDALRSLLEMLTRIMESSIIVTAEMRPKGDNTDAFKIASANSKVLLSLMTACSKVLALLGNLLQMTDVDETAVTSAEALCRSLIFVENAGTEKESALGVKSFESIRRAAMDVLSKIFARHADQRQSIFDDVLTSLERLPVTRQSARQYPVADAKPIQLVSALLMRLIQTSATYSPPPLREITIEGTQTPVSESESSEFEDDASDGGVRHRRRTKKAKTSHSHYDSLESLVVPLYDSAFQHAAYVVNFLVSRALSASKSSDEPYRNLLDIFVEDFLNVLGNSNWPAAELLLFRMLKRLFELTDNTKSSAPAKAMALELMGSMLSGITDLQSHAQRQVQNGGHEQSDLSNRLHTIHETLIADDSQDADFLAMNGVYRVVFEYLQARSNNDAQIPTACGYFLTQWGQQLLSSKQDVSTNGSQSSEPADNKLKKQLAEMIKDSERVDLNDNFADVSTEDGRLASLLVTLRQPFCRMFNHIFNKLLTSMNSDQASLRSKSLKSVDQALEKDPSVLDRGNFVLVNIVRCLADSSPQVRDSALGLLAKCLVLRPKLDVQVLEHIIQRTNDTTVGVKKRSMKILKDLYLRNDATQARSRIADALVHRISDLEESVQELARQILEEIWITPLHGVSAKGSEAAQTKLRVRQQASLLVSVVQRSESIKQVLQDLLQDIMSAKSKASPANTAVCRELVRVMVDAIIDETELPGSPKRPATMQTLAVFAKANPRLFEATQIQPILPYVKNLSQDDDLVVYKYAVTVLCHTLPQIPNLLPASLIETQTALLATIQKIPPSELKEAVACLWAVTGILENPEKVAVTTRSALEGIRQRSTQDLNDQPQIAKQMRKLIYLAGHFVSAFDVDPHLERFTERFADFKGDSVSALAIDLICPFTSPKQPLLVRESALESICRICETWPKGYRRADVCQSIDIVLQSRESSLEQILMQAFKSFFNTDKRADATDPTIGKGVEAGAERIGNTYVATDRDEASTSLAQRFLPDVLRIALNSTADIGLLSAQVVVNINRSGLVHPKESAPCLVALESSPNREIAQIAFEEHQALFSKHESMYEKENIRSIQQAFTYQRDVIHHSLGYTGQPPVPKLRLFWEVMKTASAKTRKRLLSNICSRLAFEPLKIDVSGEIPFQVEFTRFCVENLAFFDYHRADDLQQLVAGLETVVTGVGPGVAHGIEALLLKLTVNDSVAVSDMGNSTLAPSVSDTIAVATPVQLPVQVIDQDKLRALTVASQALSLVWETRTYLRRVWNLNKPPQARGRPAKDKEKAKDATRAPARVPNTSGLIERYLARVAEISTALISIDSQQAMCLGFQKLMSIDDEIKVADADADGIEQDMMLEEGYATPSDDAGESTRSGSHLHTPGKRGKKRKSAGPSTPGGTPKKRRAGSQGPGSKR